MYGTVDYPTSNMMKENSYDKIMKSNTVIRFYDSIISTTVV